MALEELNAHSSGYGDVPVELVVGNLIDGFGVGAELDLVPVGMLGPDFRDNLEEIGIRDYAVDQIHLSKPFMLSIILRPVSVGSSPLLSSPERYPP